MKIRQASGLLFLSLMILILPGYSAAQNPDTLYLRYEYLKVTNEQESTWQEMVDFLIPVMGQRLERGEIQAEYIFSLEPGGVDQGYQYLRVTVFNDPTAMMERADYPALARAAYPDAGEEDIQARLRQLPAVMDVGRTYYLERIAATESDFLMPEGGLVVFAHMKVPQSGYEAYEQAEMEVFQPLHQRQVEDGNMQDWLLRRLISPGGSSALTSHIAVNMYSGYDQYFSRPQLSDRMQSETEN